jgi:SOS-response transcriptional repressor LexA
VFDLKNENRWHPTDANVEDYAWFRLKVSLTQTLEVHLLDCETCRARVATEDKFRELLLLDLTQKWDQAPVGLIGIPVVPHESSRLVMINQDSRRSRAVSKVFHFRTHIPLYNLEAAAGRFGEQHLEVEPEGWVEITPGAIRITRDMFATHIKGDSMEPTIQDGSICAFRSDVCAPYNGKILLMEDYSETGGDRYAVKRYRTSSNADPNKKGDAAWLHERVTLESVNPDYPPTDIPSAAKVNVIGEFVFAI